MAGPGWLTASYYNSDPARWFQAERHISGPPWFLCADGSNMSFSVQMQGPAPSRWPLRAPSMATKGAAPFSRRAEVACPFESKLTPPVGQRESSHDFVWHISCISKTRRGAQCSTICQMQFSWRSFVRSHISFPRYGCATAVRGKLCMIRQRTPLGCRKD
jgi:hypothetical protein